MVCWHSRGMNNIKILFVSFCSGFFFVVEYMSRCMHKRTILNKLIVMEPRCEILLLNFKHDTHIHYIHVSSSYECVCVCMREIKICVS